MNKRERFREYCRKKFKEEWKPAYDEFIKLYPFTTESLEGEIWLPIPDYEGYHGSNFGRVKSFKYNTPRILKPLLTAQGYLHVTLRKNGKEKKFRLNVLVGNLFIPNPDNKPEVNHIFSRFSNHIDCLEWATGSENQKHAVATGLKKSGEDNCNAKLTNEQVLYIRENPDGLTQKQLAEKFCVGRTTIDHIQRGDTYKNAGGPIRDKIDNRISDEERAQILADYQPGVRGHGCRAVAKRFGVSRKTVQNIVNGR